MLKEIDKSVAAK